MKTESIASDRSDVTTHSGTSRPKMPSNHLNSVTVVRETMDLKEYHKRRNPNIVVFNPNRSQCSLAKVQFEEDTRNVVTKPQRPQSAFIISCSGYQQQKKPVEKKRPQSATTYKQKYPEPKPKPVKKRPQSASTYKSSSTEISTVEEEPLSVSELAKDVEEISIGKKFYTRRVWRPKKKENGILQPPPPPPPIRHDCTGQFQKGEHDGKPHLNNMAQFRWYKYPQTFHSYGQTVKRSRRFAPTLVGVPDCLKRAPHYGYSATRQSCRYKPFASVTSIDHHHKVGSAALPHPIKQVATPPGPSPRIELLPADNTFTQEVDAQEEEDDEAGNNNGSYSFKYQESSRHNITYTEDEEYTDRYRTPSDTERSTERSERPASRSTEQNDDLYFLTRNLQGQDGNKNNNKTSANVTVTDIEEVQESDHNLESKIEEIEELESRRATPEKVYSSPREGSVRSAGKGPDDSYLVDIIEDGDDGSDDDDVNFSDIPSIPSEIEDELDKLRSKNQGNGRPVTAKFRSQHADSDDEAKPISDEEI